MGSMAFIRASILDLMALTSSPLLAVSRSVMACSMDILSSWETLSPSSSRDFLTVYTAVSAWLWTSTSSIFFLSASANFSACLTSSSISSLLSLLEEAMVIFCSLPVPRSLAETLMMPLASMSKVTSIWGTPLLAGGIPSRTNLPREVLSAAMGLSPCTTLISTEGWLSTAVENTCDFLVGMVVFLSISLVATPPRVSMPRDRGVTSSSRTSLTSPDRTAPWMAAPMETHSIGSIPRWILGPTMLSTKFWMMGILVGPPTRMILSILSGLRRASDMAWSMGPLHLDTMGSTSSSSLARVMVWIRCLGPVASDEMNGRLISVCMVVDSSIFAFSHASLTLQKAMLSAARSMPVSFWNSPMTYFVRASSMSDPPSWVSPEVDSTWKTPSLKSMMVTSRVPPPRSKTMIFCSTSDLSRPYARAAAVGSLMIRTTSSPAMAPASFVACLWLSLKYAGTVMTAFSTVSPR